LAPKPNSDGTCATYTIVQNDDCYDIAFNHYLKQDDLYTFNNNKTCVLFHYPPQATHETTRPDTDI